MKISREEIEKRRTEKGGFTRAQLAEWGVPWPPPSGWMRGLCGEDGPTVLTDRTPSAWEHCQITKVLTDAKINNLSADGWRLCAFAEGPTFIRYIFRRGKP